jgi:hypothetical protein
MAVSAYSQDKPRVFVQGKGSENVSSNGGAGGGHHWAAWGSKSTIDSHDESMEVTKDLQKNCSGVMITINEFYQKGCQEKTSASTGGEMFSRSPAHWN